MAGYKQADSAQGFPYYDEAGNVAGRRQPQISGRSDDGVYSPTGQHGQIRHPLNGQTAPGAVYGSDAGTFSPQESHPGYPRSQVPPANAPEVSAQPPQGQGHYTTEPSRNISGGQGHPVVSRSAPYDYGGQQAPSADGFYSGSQHPDDFQPSADHPAPQADAPRRSPVHYAGALVSVALIAGLGVWGYKIAMRDVNGIPVVRALEGDMRVLPDDPGGRQASHQGLSVNQVQADGEAAPVADRVILAPPPIELFAEDAPVPTTATVTAVAPVAADTAPEPDAVSDAVSNAVLASLTTPVTADEGPASETAVTETAATEPALVAETDTAPETEELAAISERIPATVPGVSRSKIPLPRPVLDLSQYNRLVASTDEAVSLALISAAEQTSVDAEPSTVLPGATLVQLGAYNSEEIAREEWDRIAGNFESHFDGKQRVIQAASSGGRDFFRLRVMGFDDMSDARRFCSELIANSAACIPAVNH